MASLFDLLVDQPPRPHKAARQTSREVYRRQRTEDTAKRTSGKEDRQAQVLRCLAAYWNRHQVSPTALELLAWMKTRREPAFDINSVRPRLTALVARGVVEPRAKRRCQVSGNTVWTWAVREVGSCEPR